MLKHRINFSKLKTTNNYKLLNEKINRKLERVIIIFDGKIHKAQANMIKWIIGSAVLQIIYQFAMTLWGI